MDFCVTSSTYFAPFVRIDEISRSPVLKMLDAGAAGLIVPQLESVEQAEKLVSWAKFAPLGNRGYCPAEMAGFKTVGQCEWADYPTKVLEKHWPEVPRWRDITIWI